MQSQNMDHIRTEKFQSEYPMNQMIHLRIPESDRGCLCTRCTHKLITLKGNMTASVKCPCCCKECYENNNCQKCNPDHTESECIYNGRTDITTLKDGMKGRHLSGLNVINGDPVWIDSLDRAFAHITRAMTNDGTEWVVYFHKKSCEVIPHIRIRDKVELNKYYHELTEPITDMTTQKEMKEHYEHALRGLVELDMMGFKT